MDLLPHEVVVHIMSYLNLENCINFIKGFPHLKDILYSKTLVRKLVIYELTNTIRDYLKEFPLTKRHFVEELNMSYVQVSIKDLYLVSFIASLTNLRVLWILGTRNIQPRIFKNILTKIGPQLHTLGMSWFPENILNEIIFRDLKCLYLQMETNCNFLLKIKETQPNLHLEYLWIESIFDNQAGVYFHPHLKEMVWYDRDLPMCHGTAMLLLDLQRPYAYQSFVTEPSQIMKKLGTRVMAHSEYGPRYLNAPFSDKTFHKRHDLDSLQNLLGFSSTVEYFTILELTNRSQPNFKPPQRTGVGASQSAPDNSHFRECIDVLQNTCNRFELETNPLIPINVAKTGCWNEYILQDIARLKLLSHLTLVNVQFYNIGFLDQISRNCEMLSTLRLTIDNPSQSMFRGIYSTVSKMKKLEHFRYEQINLECSFDSFFACLSLLPNLKRYMCVIKDINNIPRQEYVWDHFLKSVSPKLKFLGLICGRTCFRKYFKKYDVPFAYYVENDETHFRNDCFWTNEEVRDHNYYEMVLRRPSVVTFKILSKDFLL